MGLFDRLSKEGRERASVDKQIKRVMNKYIQSVDRFGAMEKLRENGSDEALYGLARRFSYVYDKTIEDEQEKEWVAATLASFGERVIAPLERYAASADTLSYPLRVFERVTTPERMLEIVDRMLEREPPEYTRDPTKKIQLLTWLSEWKAVPAAEVSRRIVPYLGDFDEGVRFAAVDALARQKHEETARGPLLDALLRPEEESRRVKVRVAEVLAEAGWTVTDRKDAVAKLLQAELPEFGMQHDKLRKKDR